MYNLKRNTKLYIVELNGAGAATNKHQIEIYSDITASQTFDEQSYKRKTLHTQLDLHEHAVISKANPANFSFTTPLLSIATVPIVLTLCREYSTGTLVPFDIYLETDTVVYKLEKSIIESITFNITKEAIITLSVSGTGAKLSKFGNVGSVTIPGTTFSVGAKQYTYANRLDCTIGGTALSSVAALNVDLKNDVEWLTSTTIQGTLSGTTSYPQTYVLQNRSIYGSVTQFLTTENIDNLSDTSVSSTLVLDVYSTSYSTSLPILKFNLPSVVFTRRIGFDDIINRVYDYRLNTNTTTVKPLYKGV